MTPIRRQRSIQRPDDDQWRLLALCRNEDPALFFHPDGERGTARARRRELAKLVCAQCPVQQQCRDHSVRRQEPFGMWGGLSEEERARFLPSTAIHIRAHRTLRREHITGEGQMPAE